MKTITTLLVCALALGAQTGGSGEPLDDSAQKNLTIADSAAGIWMWTDKVVYGAGDPITLKWTAKPNGDTTPYTWVLYRQNNQTGAKTYLPGNTATPTDLFGRAFGEYSSTPIQAAEKQTVVGESGWVAQTPLAAPAEFGMHTLVMQLRDASGSRVIKSVYVKFGVVEGFEDLPSNIDSDRTLTSNKAYRITGIVSVRNNATLTIEPGTYLIGQPGSQPPSVLLVTTAGKLVAEGTRSRPIIMTSSQPVGSRNRGDWGGLVMLGRAPLNDPGRSLSIEGLPDLPETRYGGDDANHSCGSLRYVRVEFAGALLRPNEETNSFTWGGCGKGTKAEYLQATYGLDDSFEWFGGNNDAKYLVGTYGADDYIDVQIGYTGRIQHVFVAANDDLSNRGVEADNYERDFAARPLGKAQMWNMTFVGGGARGFDETDSPCLFYRRGAGGITNNVVCFNWITRTLGGANFDSISPNINNGDFNMNGILGWNNGREASRANSIDGQISTDFQAFARDARRNFLFSDTLLRRPLERSDPDPRPQPGSPAFRTTWLQPPDDGFFDQWATWAGGFGEVNWTEEWTNFIQEQDMK